MGCLGVNWELTQSFLLEMKNNLVSEFLNQFREYGAEEKNIKQWATLINLRFDEYNGHYKLALKEAKKTKEFKDEEELGAAWARIETITIDCLTHIRRGKVEEKDPLWKLLRKWVIMRGSEITPIINLAQDKDS